MSVVAETSKGSALPTSLGSLKSPREVLSLGVDDLHTLLTVANQEMEVVEAMIEKAEAALALAGQKEQESVAVKKGTKAAGVEAKKGIQLFAWLFKISPIGSLCMALGIFGASITMEKFEVLGFMFVAVLFFGVIKLFLDQRVYRKKLDGEADMAFTEAKQIYAEADAAIDAAQATRLIPKDYRYTLALSTMLKYIENGRASTWTEAADRYEIQLHQWEMEKNSDEMLEYQKFIALATEQTAKSAGAAATFSGISAVVNIARLFR